jgi:hypothetical protein
MIASSVFSLCLIGLSGLLIDSHRRSRQRLNRAVNIGEASRVFACAQFRRRMSASGMIGVLGVAIAVGPLVPRRPVPMTIYLAILLLGLGWIVLMALFDVFATHSRYRELRRAAAAKLPTELERVCRER